MASFTWNLRTLALIPQILSAVLTIESDITTIRTGPEKRAAALDLVRQGIAVADAITGHPIVPDEEAFLSACGPVIDAIVAALNVSQPAGAA